MRLASGVCALSFLLPACFPQVFSDNLDGRVSEAVRLHYDIETPYEKILEQADFENQSGNRKYRIEIAFKGLSTKPLVAPYAKILSKTVNNSVLFSGSLPKLPVFVGEAKTTLVKRFSEAKPGTKLFVYATLAFSWQPAYNVDPKSSKSKPGPDANVRVAYFLVDDVLSAEEELAFEEVRKKFGGVAAKKDAQAPQPPGGQAPVKKKYAASPAVPGGPEAGPVPPSDSRD